MVLTLLRIHLRQARNRLRSGRAARWTVAGGVLGSAAILAALAALGHRILLPVPDLSDATLSGRDALVGAFDRAFWLNAVLAFVLGYTTFEALFRSPSSRPIEALPVGTGALFAERIVTLFVLHIPLLLAALAFEAPLAFASPRLFLHAAVLHGATWVFGLSTGVALHLEAGRSLLRGGSSLKEAFGGGYHVNEAAMLLYSPAAAFALTLFAAIPLEIFARSVILSPGAEGTNAGPAIVAVVAIIGLSAAALVYGYWVYRASWRVIRARFTEAEVLPVWREVDLPTEVFGRSMLRWLRPPLLGLTRKDLLQLRRRHRLDLTLLVAFVGAMLLFHLRTSLDTSALLGWDAALLLLSAGVVLNPSFKLAGDELEPRGLLRTLPVSLSSLRRAKALTALSHGAPLALAVGLLYGLTTSDVVGALSLALGGLVTSAAISLVFLRLTFGRRRHGTWIAWIVRGAVATIALLLPGILASGAWS